MLPMQMGQVFVTMHNKCHVMDRALFTDRHWLFIIELMNTGDNVDDRTPPWLRDGNGSSFLTHVTHHTLDP